MQTAAPSQIQPTGERAPSAGGGKRGKTGGGVVYNSSTSGASNNKVNTMGFFAGDGDNNELENSQMGGEATYKSPGSPILYKWETR